MFVGGEMSETSEEAVRGPNLPGEG